ncbi:hypothetical protein PsYK624_141040 [Phanerochaete sordida]|uniref:Uncharacterized protein n=1 Tax=Phanerochaete sordida TaxID=48140 RepID=A0A9P3GLZ0_9APHY|nr:hypothetical protein PsYK624_141040 [Phanerochaete sordida]
MDRGSCAKPTLPSPGDDTQFPCSPSNNDGRLDDSKEVPFPKPKLDPDPKPPGYYCLYDAWIRGVRSGTIPDFDYLDPLYFIREPYRVATLSLKCNIWTSKTRRSVGAAIRRTRHALRELRLDLYGMPWNHAQDNFAWLSSQRSTELDRHGTELDLDKCPSLEVLDLNLPSPASWPTAPFLDTLFAELCSRPRGQQKKLKRIIVRIGSFEALQAVKLDKTLEKHFLRGSPTRVRIALSMRAGLSRWELDAAVSWMPAMTRRGLLYLHPDGDEDPSVKWDAISAFDRP